MPSSGRLRLFLFLLAPALAIMGLLGCSVPKPPESVMAVPPTLVVIADPAALPEPEPAPEPAAARLIAPDQLAGMRAPELSALLGPPDFRRSEPPAELWQYRGADCVLDIFLYRDAGGYRVAQSVVRNRHALAPGTAPCTASGALDGRNRRS